MTVNSNGSQVSRIDAVVSRSLSKTYANLTRRSFLSFLTRKAIGLAGIAVAGEILPYFVSSARADDMNCGLHGYICASDTTCWGGVGNNPNMGSKWVQCCEITCPPGQCCPIVGWNCCHYIDYCGTRPSGWGTDCIGDETPSGPSWCGDGRPYICTGVTCVNSGSSSETCRANCQTPVECNSYPHE